MLNHIRTVLIHNSHPGNIGAAARAMKNMGLSRLYLVAPKEFPSDEATARATSAKDILENAIVVSRVEEALVGCNLILGTSSRERSLSWPLFTAREAAEKIISELDSNSDSKSTDKPLEVAILYGCEQSGLSNQELQYCHAQIMIPTNTEHASLNLAQAVQIISYELWVAATSRSSIFAKKAKEAKETKKEEDCSRHIHLAEQSLSANFEETSGFYDHLEQALVDIQYLDRENPGQLMPRLKRLFGRAGLDKVEINILRGILTTLQKKVI